MLPPSLDILLLDPAQALGGSLSSLGHRPFAAAGVDPLLAMLEARPFDAVVVAGGTGPAATMAAAAVHRVRGAEQSRVALTPVIAVVPAVMAGALAAAGADEVVEWPIGADRLAGVLGPLSPDRYQEAPIEVLHGDGRVAEILQLFQATLEHQAAALRREGVGALGRVAHRIAGAAANVGYADLAFTAATAAGAAKAGGKAETAACCELAAALEATHAAVRKRLAGLPMLENAE